MSATFSSSKRTITLHLEPLLQPFTCLWQLCAFCIIGYGEKRKNGKKICQIYRLEKKIHQNDLIRGKWHHYPFCRSIFSFIQWFLRSANFISPWVCFCHWAFQSLENSSVLGLRFLKRKYTKNCLGNSSRIPTPPIIPKSPRTYRLD